MTMRIPLPESLRPPEGVVPSPAMPRDAATIALVRDGDARIVVDPGMVASRSLILDPLASLGVAPRYTRSGTRCSAAKATSTMTPIVSGTALP